MAGNHKARMAWFYVAIFIILAWKPGKKILDFPKLSGIISHIVIFIFYFVHLISVYTVCHTHLSFYTSYKGLHSLSYSSFILYVLLVFT